MRIANRHIREQEPDAFKRELAKLVLVHMPWPYEDVDRNSVEAADCAIAIAQVLADEADEEFKELSELLSVVIRRVK